ncbi:MAG: hypothetical protein K2J80_10705 [Oscillospiraceae bacterium]|nr:hypothetical protein [Oscillospiraceae bacterium]
MKKILSAVLACAATLSISAFAFAEDAAPATPGDTDAPGGSVESPVEIKAELTVGTEGLSGEALSEKLLSTADGKKYSWSDVESITFSSDKLFSVSFAADKDKAGVDVFTMGKDVIAIGGLGGPGDDVVDERAAATDPTMNTEWTLTADHIALFDTSKVYGGDIKLVAQEDGTVINATVEIKAGAEPADDPKNEPTGIALAIAPAGLAVAFVTVAAVMSKKKKG